MTERKLRILIIGINYEPEKTGIGPYTAGLARHLASRGHSVEVVTGLPSYPEWRVHESFRRVLWKTELIDGVRVHRRFHYVPRRQSAISRLAYEGSFLLSGLSSLLLHRPDMVVGVIPTLSGGVLARLVARRFGVSCCLIFQDLMGPAAAQAGISGANRVAALVGSIEGWVARNSSAVGIIAAGFRGHLESLGVSAEKIHRVRNWSRVTSSSEDQPVTRKRLGWGVDTVVCLHAGNMGHKQGLENIVECARLAQDRGEAHLRFVLLGEGNQRCHLEKLVAGYGLLNLEFLPLQAEDDFANVLAAADILLLNQRTGVAEMALPSKLTAYLAAGRPVVAAVERDSETAHQVLESGGGIIVEPSQSSALLEMICHLASDQAIRGSLGKRGKVFANSKLSEYSATRELERFLTATVASASDTPGTEARVRAR